MPSLQLKLKKGGKMARIGADDTLQPHPEELVARLDRLPLFPYSRWVLILIGGGWFFAQFDIGAIGFALPSALRAYHIGAGVGAAAISMGLLGYVLGEFVVSIIGDRWGRRLALFLAIALYAIGSLANALAPDALSFVGARCLSGAGIGGFIGASSAYVAEILPAPIRGRFAAWTTMPGFFGIGLVPFIALALLPHSEIGWRVLLAIPALVVVPSLLGAGRLPESVRWLVEHERSAEAERVVATAEDFLQRKTGRALPPVQAAVARVVEVAERRRFGFGSILRPPLLRRTVVLFLVWFFNYAGVYAFLGVGITLLVAHGYTFVHSVQMSIAGSIGGVVGAVLAPFITDRFSRKWPPLVVTAILVIELLALAIAPSSFLITLLFFLLFFQVGVFVSTVCLLTAEHFPTAARNLGVAATDGLGHLGGAIGPIAATTIYATFGFQAVFFCFAGTFAICAVCLYLTQDTSRRNLEEILIEGQASQDLVARTGHAV